MPDWLLVVMTRKPCSLSCLIASAAPGNSRSLPGSWRKPGSSMMVPSRSRKTARLLPSAICRQRGDDDFDLFGQNRARIQQGPAARDAGNDGRVVRAQALDERRVGESREPGPQLGAGKCAAADLGITLDQLAPEPRRALADAFFILGQHVEHRNLPDRDIPVAIERERRLEAGERELVRADGARNRIGAAGRDRLFVADEDAGLRAAEQFVAAEHDY